MKFFGNLWMNVDGKWNSIILVYFEGFNLLNVIVLNIYNDLSILEENNDY